MSLIDPFDSEFMIHYQRVEGEENEQELDDNGEIRARFFISHAMHIIIITYAFTLPRAAKYIFNCTSNSNYTKTFFHSSLFHVESTVDCAEDYPYLKELKMTYYSALCVYLNDIEGRKSLNVDFRSWSCGTNLNSPETWRTYQRANPDSPDDEGDEYR